MNITEPPIIGLKEIPETADMVKEKALRKACADFEAIIFRQMLSAMRKSIPDSGLFEKSHAREIYESMNDEKLADKMAHGKGSGLGELLFKQLTGKVKSTITR